MTDQTSIVTKRATLVARRTDVVAPPHAPLAMPKQALVRDHSVIRTGLSALLSRISMLKFSSRSAN